MPPGWRRNLSWVDHHWRSLPPVRNQVVGPAVHPRWAGLLMDLWPCQPGHRDFFPVRRICPAGGSRYLCPAAHRRYPVYPVDPGHLDHLVGDQCDLALDLVFVLVRVVDRCFLAFSSVFFSALPII